MKRVNGYWVDENNNRWDCDIYTEEQAQRYSRTLMNCTNCTDCSYCTNCRDCTDCRHCRYCTDFNSNPQRLTSPKLGSEDRQTTIYWLKDEYQVVCGCFRGDLEEFRAKIIERHSDNNYAKGYLAWLDKAEAYIKSVEVIE